ncbi:MAG: hypothetical protein WEB00_10865 [Dehalococcoidia bacterium]
MADNAAIYDLGYSHYQGGRLAYSASLFTLYVESVRIAFGLGRRFVYKVAPLTLLLIAVVPAAIALGIASVIGDEIEPYRYDNYYGIVALTIALFCAVVAPDLVGRDVRNRTLALYVSRGISRLDYIAIKIAALISATLLFSLIPQAMLFLGNALAARNTFTYVTDNIEAIPRIIASALVIGLLLGSLAVAFAAQTTNRAYATGGFVALVVLSTAITNILFEAGDGGDWVYVLLGGVLDVLEGSTEFIFSSPIEPGTDRDRAEFERGYYLVSLLAVSAAAIALTVRRYLRMPL